jgi:hypothetical protein
MKKLVKIVISITEEAWKKLELYDLEVAIIIGHLRDKKKGQIISVSEVLHIESILLIDRIHLILHLIDVNKVLKYAIFISKKLCEDTTNLEPKVIKHFDDALKLLNADFSSDNLHELAVIKESMYKLLWIARKDNKSKEKKRLIRIFHSIYETTQAMYFMLLYKDDSNINTKKYAEERIRKNSCNCTKFVFNDIIDSNLIVNDLINISEEMMKWKY